MDKRSLQLGMNASTAANRLRSDLLFSFVKLAGHKCHRCGGELTRESFSVEHIKPWLGADDAVELFFDIENIAFSHQSCNYSAGGKGRSTQFTPEDRASRDRASKARHWTPEKRREHYLRTGR
jgi:hypothetical protein